METIKANGDGGPRDYSIHGAKLAHRLVGFQVSLNDEDLLVALGFSAKQFKMGAVERYSGGFRIVVTEQ